MLISGYWSPLYAAALHNRRTITFTANTRGGRPAREYLWMNYPPPTELHDYRYLGNEKRERERITRKVRTWSAGLLRLPQLEREAILSGISDQHWTRRQPDANAVLTAARALWYNGCKWSGDDRSSVQKGANY